MLKTPRVHAHASAYTFSVLAWELNKRFIHPLGTHGSAARHDPGRRRFRPRAPAPRRAGEGWEAAGRG